jgi:hypothetical protein
MTGIAGAVYAISLALPVFYFGDGHPPMYGFKVLLVGGLGVFLLEPAWIANLIFFIVFAMLLTENARASVRVISAVGIVVALTAFAATEVSFESVFSERGETVSILHLGIGIYVWIASFVVLFLASWTIAMPPPPSASGLDPHKTAHREPQNRQ